MPKVHIQQVRVRVVGRGLADVRRSVAELPRALSRALADHAPASSQLAVGRAPLAQRVATPLAASVRSALKGKP